MTTEHKNCVEGCLAAIEIHEVGTGKRIEKVEMHRENCNKTFQNPDGCYICTAYLTPALKWKLGTCALASNVIHDEIVKKTVGQRKQKSFR
jgi:hypothetical protein